MSPTYSMQEGSRKVISKMPLEKPGHKLEENQQKLTELNRLMVRLKAFVVSVMIMILHLP
jgi:hypothetical protein